VHVSPAFPCGDTDSPRENHVELLPPMDVATPDGPCLADENVESEGTNPPAKREKDLGTLVAVMPEPWVRLWALL
jgi:hypothetical protein